MITRKKKAKFRSCYGYMSKSKSKSRFRCGSVSGDFSRIWSASGDSLRFWSRAMVSK